MDDMIRENPFKLLQESVEEVLSSFGLLEVDHYEYLDEEVRFRGSYLVSMVGFVGSYTGLISIYCSRSLALLLTERMTGIEIEQVNQEVRDVLAELTNMVTGNFKAKLSQSEELFQLSIPSVIDGDNFSTNSVDTIENGLLICKSDAGELYIQLNVRKNDSVAA